MAVTKTTHVSYGSRLGNSLKGVVGGFAMLLIGIVLLWWNEGRAVRTAQDLKLGRKNCVETTYDKIDNELDGKLIHVMGSASTSEVLTDPHFKVSVNGFALIRKTEMYQWKERQTRTEEENVGGSMDVTITYNYDKVWSDSPIDSSGFEEAGHNNPPMQYRAPAQYAKQAQFGARIIKDDDVKGIGKATDFDLAANEAIKAELAKTAEDGGPFGLADRPCQLSGNTLFIGENPNDPEIGDIRISFSYKPSPCDISVVGQQAGNTIIPWQSKNGTIYMLHNGLNSSAQMFTSAERGNAITTWILRLVGFVLIFSGFRSIFAIIPTLGAIIPFLGKALSAGVGVLSFALSAVISLLVIAISWLFYRPVLGIALIAAAIAVTWYARKKGGAAEAAKPAAETTPPPAA